MAEKNKIKSIAKDDRSKEQQIIFKHSLPYNILSRIFLFLSPQDRLPVRLVSKEFCKVISIAWQLQLGRLSSIIKGYHQAIDAYPAKQSIACKVLFQSYVTLKTKVLNFPRITLSTPQAISCAEYKQIIVCLGLLFGLSETDINLENASGISESIEVMNLLKSGFDPLYRFGNDEIKKGRKQLRNLSANEPLYLKCKEISNAFSLACFAANCYRVSKKLSVMPMLPLMERKHAEEANYNSLNTVYIHRLAKYNP